jgi:hypothetical protein
MKRQSERTKSRELLHAPDMTQGDYASLVSDVIHNLVVAARDKQDYETATESAAELLRLTAADVPFNIPWNTFSSQGVPQLLRFFVRRGEPLPLFANSLLLAVRISSDNSTWFQELKFIAALLDIFRQGAPEFQEAALTVLANVAGGNQSGALTLVIEGVHQQLVEILEQSLPDALAQLVLQVLANMVHYMVALREMPIPQLCAVARAFAFFAGIPGERDFHAPAIDGLASLVQSHLLPAGELVSLEICAAVLDTMRSVNPEVGRAAARFAMAVLQSDAPDIVAGLMSFQFLTETLTIAQEKVRAGICEVGFFVIRQLRNGGDAIAAGFLETVMAQVSQGDYAFRVFVLDQFARCVAEGSDELIMYVANLQVFALFQELLDSCDPHLCIPILSAFGALFTMLAKVPDFATDALDIAGLEDRLLSLIDIPEIGELAQAVQELVH